MCMASKAVTALRSPLVLSFFYLLCWLCWFRTKKTRNDSIWSWYCVLRLSSMKKIVLGPHFCGVMAFGRVCYIIFGKKLIPTCYSAEVNSRQIDPTYLIATHQKKNAISNRFVSPELRLKHDIAPRTNKKTNTLDTENGEGEVDQQKVKEGCKGEVMRRARACIDNWQTHRPLLFSVSCQAGKDENVIIFVLCLRWHSSPPSPSLSLSLLLPHQAAWSGTRLSLFIARWSLAFFSSRRV